MKKLLALATFILLVGGCTKDAGVRPVSSSTSSPAGTDVGTSFPGVNQPTTTTTATRSDNPTAEPPNSRR